MLGSLRSISNKTFYRELPWWLKISTCYIYGDTIVLLPILMLIGLSGLYWRHLMLFLLGSYLIIRGLGEMFYWLLQQFGEKNYRPYDFGFKNLDNNAIYILYQLISIVVILLGCSLFYLNTTG